MLQSFERVSYLAQTRRLRKMAELAVKEFPLRLVSLDFINHGENATYKVIAKEGLFLLRLHREGYHSKFALKEELKWLESLARYSSLSVQQPLKSRNGQYLVQINIPEAPSRFCSVLRWVEGRQRYLNLTPDNFRKTGILTGDLHGVGQKCKVKYRNYWVADKLLGKKATLGDYQQFIKFLEKDQKIISGTQSKLLKKMKEYESSHSKKMGMIHADLHFGNILWNRGEILPIDFDDCGFGSYLYDIGVTLMSVNKPFKLMGRKRSQACLEAYFEGYGTRQDLSSLDLKILPYYMLTRELNLLLWLFERRSNPSVFKHFNWFRKRCLKSIQRAEKGHFSIESLLP